MDRLEFWAELAGYPLRLTCAHPYSAELFRDYRVVPTAEREAAYRALTAGMAAPGAPLGLTGAELAGLTEGEEGFPPGYLESLELYRRICDLLLERDVLLIHGSAVALDGRACLFTAPSGTGKSTHARLWRERFGRRLTMINDDKPLLKFCPDGQVLVCGTPYAGKEGLHTNTAAPLAGIVALRQAPRDAIRALSAREALPLLYAQTYREARRPGQVHRTLDLLGRLCRLPVFLLDCTVSRQAVNLASQAVMGE